jgi:hypothetical protein
MTKYLTSMCVKTLILSHNGIVDFHNQTILAVRGNSSCLMFESSKFLNVALVNEDAIQESNEIVVSCFRFLYPFPKKELLHRSIDNTFRFAK